jgi:glycerol-3-phosphate cytidylyltransferase-like family protein
LDDIYIYLCQLLEHASLHICRYSSPYINIIRYQYTSGRAPQKAKRPLFSFEKRKAVISAIDYVDEVIESEREDSDVWAHHKYDMHFVGSDYKGTERFNRYEEYFADKGVEIVYFPYT